MLNSFATACSLAKLSNRSAKALRKNFRFFTLSKSTQVLSSPSYTTKFQVTNKNTFKKFKVERERPYFSSRILSIAPAPLLFCLKSVLPALHYYPQSALKREISQTFHDITTPPMYEQQNAFWDFPLLRKGDYIYRRCKSTFHPQKIYLSSTDAVTYEKITVHANVEQTWNPRFYLPICSSSLLLLPALIIAFFLDAKAMPNVLFYPLMKKCFEQGTSLYWRNVTAARILTLTLPHRSSWPLRKSERRGVF